MAADQRSLNIVSDQFGGSSSARSIAEVILKIIGLYEQNADLPWVTYHFSQTPDVTRHEFAKHVVKQGKAMRLIPEYVQVHPVSCKVLSLRAHRPPNSCLDTSLIQKTFGLEVSGWTDEMGDFLIATSTGV